MNAHPLSEALARSTLVHPRERLLAEIERMGAEITRDYAGRRPVFLTVMHGGQITGALVGIGLVLSAVFVPMAFFGGSTGVIYRQFSITIVSAMALSVLVAIIFTPAENIGPRHTIRNGKPSPIG